VALETGDGRNVFPMDDFGVFIGPASAAGRPPSNGCIERAQSNASKFGPRRKRASDTALTFFYRGAAGPCPFFNHIRASGFQFQFLCVTR
jgi:hypothetical protein